MTGLPFPDPQSTINTGFPQRKQALTMHDRPMLSAGPE
jgi:hypothetical protein